MTRKQKLLTLVAGLIAAYLLTWPVAVLMIWFYAEVNGDVPTVSEKEGGA